MTKRVLVTPLIDEIDATVMSILDLSTRAKDAHSDNEAIGYLSIALPQAEVLTALINSAIHINRRNNQR